MVSRCVRVAEAPGSNPGSPTFLLAMLTPASDWDHFVFNNEFGHFLQTREWSYLKSLHGWDIAHSRVYNNSDLIGGSEVLLRNLPLRFGKIAHIPCGPICQWKDSQNVKEVIFDAIVVAKLQGAIVLIIEPIIDDSSQIQKLLIASGFKPDVFSPQPPRTIILDIDKPNDFILAKMKPKTRYNINLARRHGVQVREGSENDIVEFYNLLIETSNRNQFSIPSIKYFYNFITIFKQASLVDTVFLVAEHESIPNKILAGIIVSAIGQKATYLYGASGNEYRELMSPYMLQWEGIQWAKRRNCISYDLWGVPDEDESVLESNFTKRSDGLWGVYRFKRGFGGTIVRRAGTWVYPISKIKWTGYQIARRYRNSEFANNFLKLLFSSAK